MNSNFKDLALNPASVVIIHTNWQKCAELAHMNVQPVLISINARPAPQDISIMNMKKAVVISVIVAITKIMQLINARDVLKDVENVKITPVVGIVSMTIL